MTSHIQNKPFSVPAVLISVFVCLFVTGHFLSPASARGATIYVKKAKTKMAEKQSARSRTVKILGKGTPVKVLKKRRFFKVSAGGKTGWIFKFRLTAKAPAGLSQDEDFLDTLGGEQRMAAKESASGSSIRGLSPTAEKHALKKGTSRESIDGVKQMNRYKSAVLYPVLVKRYKTAITL